MQSIEVPLVGLWGGWDDYEPSTTRHTPTSSFRSETPEGVVKHGTPATPATPVDGPSASPAPVMLPPPSFSPAPGANLSAGKCFFAHDFLAFFLLCFSLTDAQSSNIPSRTGRP